MAGELRRHWAKGFARKSINRPMLNRWLEEEFIRDEQGEVVSGLRARQSPQWQVRRRDVGKAIKMSGNGAPGPDGIPYRAWRKLGELGIDIIHEAMG
eukprot:2211371-Heterocapsa_arctica.AAC.1